MAVTLDITLLGVCDRCGATAYVKILMANGEWDFCAHHFAEQERKGLPKESAIITDHRSWLYESEARDKKVQPVAKPLHQRPASAES